MKQGVCVVAVLLGIGGAWVRGAEPECVRLKTGVCVPLSIVEADFEGYVDGGPAPVALWRQAMINSQTQWSDAVKLYRECVGQLGPAEAKLNAAALQQAQQALDKANQDAAPKGMKWDDAAKKYVPIKKDGEQ